MGETEMIAIVIFVLFWLVADVVAGGDHEDREKR